MALKDVEIRALKPSERVYKCTDGNGLYVEVHPNGSKLWRYKFSHLGKDKRITAVLHTWGSALTHHPHVHMIVPGGGIALDGTRWISSRAAFLLPVRVLGALFRRLFLTRLLALFVTARLSPRLMVLDGLDDVWIVDDGMKEVVPVIG